MTLSTTEQKFILHWGEMGTRWGINRTVAQIHALLFLSPRPLHAEEIATTLSVARSNVSSSLRELQGWGIVRIVHLLGDRRDHFEALKDVCDTFRKVAEERKRREFDPTLQVVQDCVQELQKGTRGSYTQERMEELLAFLLTTTALFDEAMHLPAGAIKGLTRLRGKLSGMIGLKKKLARSKD